MQKSTLEYLEIETGSNPVASVIWLHGLGADGHDFESIVPELKLPTNLAVRFIFPHAPVRPVTINNGYQMRAWYDITGMDLTDCQDEAGFKQSQQQINYLLDNEIARGIPSHKIILAGFSQGGALALHVGLRYSHALGGLLALSCYLPLIHSFQQEATIENKKTNIFMAHGTYDPVVKPLWGEQSYQFLKKAGYEISWHTYPMEHSVCLEEIQAISAWLIKMLAV